MDFKKILAVVYGIFGISAFAKGADGKSVLTSDQKKQLSDKWGEKFLQSFEADLAAEEAKGVDLTVANAEVEANKTALTEMKKQLATALEAKTTLETEKQDLEAKVVKLEKTEDVDNPEKIDMSAGKDKKVVAFKPNMAFAHNKVIDNYYYGDGSASYSGSDTVELGELQTEFGKYITGVKLDIFKSLTLGLTCTDYMTTIVTDKTQWRAMHAIIESVLQQFSPKWTPTGKAKFTPITIENYFLKVNFPITPSDIIDRYIGYLYDETKTPDQMPIVAYIVNELVLPKLVEDLEIAMATGEFVEFNPTQDGQEGSTPEASMDGYMTVLSKLKLKAGNKVTWLLPGVTLTEANILAKMDEVVDSIPYRYKRKAITIHADLDLITMYGRAYRKLYPTTKIQDGDVVKLDFSKLTFAPLDGMSGTRAFFITPKENFINLKSRNINEAKIFIQVQNYDVKVFMEFRQGTGFAMEEAIFAYLPSTFVPGESELIGSDSVGGGI
jgi:regulator of replication initiation timing